MTSTPSPAARATTAAGAKEPSENVEWDWRSKFGCSFDAPFTPGTLVLMTPVYREDCFQ
jgi:hypothetical protein